MFPSCLYMLLKVIIVSLSWVAIYCGCKQKNKYFPHRESYIMREKFYIQAFLWYSLEIKKTNHRKKLGILKGIKHE